MLTPTSTLANGGTARAPPRKPFNMIPYCSRKTEVVNVSSRAGLLKQIPNDELKARFLDKNLTIDQLDGLIAQFIEYAKQGTHIQHGYSGSAYGMSKIGVTAMTFLQQKMFNSDPGADLVVNAV
uniref:Uncharacterized protein n=1 Tax=Romanomermis culicivorax TaxID=13658 RepID=A0A915JUH8_ROMCU